MFLKFSQRQQRAGEMEEHPGLSRSPFRRPISPHLLHPEAASHPANFLRSQTRQPGGRAHTGLLSAPPPCSPGQAEARAFGASAEP